MRTVDEFHRDKLAEVLPVIHRGRRALEQEVLRADGRTCQDMDSAVWFPADGTRYRRAKILAERDRTGAMCEPCPVRVACLAAALLRGDGFGSWGGVSQPDYQLLKRLWDDSRDADDVPGDVVVRD